MECPQLCLWELSVSSMDDQLMGPTCSSSTSSSTPAWPRKWKAHPDLWKRALAKTKWAKGESYTSPFFGVEVQAREQGPPCACKKKCFEKFTQQQREKIFQCFWDLGHKNIQDAYLHGFIRVRKVCRSRPRKEGKNKTPQTSTFLYVVSANNTIAPA